MSLHINRIEFGERDHLPADIDRGYHYLGADGGRLVSTGDAGNTVYAMFANYLRQAISYDVKQNWKVHKKKDLLDLSQPIMFAKLFNYAARTLGIMQTNVDEKR